MKKTYSGLLIFLLLFSFQTFAQRTAKPQPKKQTPATAAATQRDGFSVPFVSKTLPNGLEVIVLKDSSVPLITVELAVRNGSFTEPPELNGLSHLYEHMFFKDNNAAYLNQCKKVADLSEEGKRLCAEPFRLASKIGDVGYFDVLNSAGLLKNGTTREEVVNYYYTTTSPYLRQTIKLINDAVRFPRFDAKELEEEKRVVIGELERNESNPFSFLFQELNNKLFYKFPTRKMPGGTQDTVRKATVEQMRTIQSRYYFPNNAALIVTGDADPDEVFKITGEVMGSWEKRAVDPFKEFPMVEHPPLEKSEAVILTKNTGQEAVSDDQNVFIQIGWQGPSVGVDDKGTYAADVFSYIISQPDTRFQRNMVDSGLTTNTGLNYYTQRNVGPINVLMVTTPEKAKDALKALYSEIALFDTPGYFTNEELESSKNILEANDLFDREKPSEYAHTLGFWWSSTGIEYFRGYHNSMGAVTRTDINDYVRRYIKGKKHVAVVLVSENVRGKLNLTDADLLGN